MVKLQKFAVEFESPYGVCNAGQSVVGAVCIQLSDSTNVTGVRLKLLGRAKVHWSVKRGKNSRTHYRAEELYINEHVYVFGASGGESARLEAGTHRYPFMFMLPPTVPSSFEGEVGYVRYTAEATMERPWKFNHVSRSAFTVISLVDLNMEPPEFKVPCQTSNDAVVECCCWTSGTVTATLKLSKRCYVPGETIYINAEIVNNSQTDINRTRASLKQYVEFLGKSDNFFSSGDMHSRWVSHYVASSEGPGVIAAGTTGTWNNVPMLIPATAPSRLAGCGIINANYVLKLYIDAQYTDLKMPVDILIGTVPLRESFRNPPAPQLQSVITSQPPSAPPIYQPDADIFDIPPPSYEECTTTGRVDIREEDDNEHLRGELSWCPRYPMYRQLSEPQGPSAPALAPTQVDINNV